jgi:hypothetical protein
MVDNKMAAAAAVQHAATLLILPVASCDVTFSPHCPTPPETIRITKLLLTQQQLHRAAL